MTDLLLEIVLSATIAAILALLLNAGRSTAISTLPGWKTMLAGFVLLLVGSAADITDDIPALNFLILLGDTPQQAFLENIVGYAGGFLLVAVGLAKWLPVVAEGRERENELYLVKERYRMVSGLTTDLACAVGLDETGSPHMEWSVGSLHSSSGYTHDDIRTLDQWRSIVHPEERERFDAFLQSALAGSRGETELRVTTRTERILWVALSATPQTDDSGRVVRLLGAVRDVTARKEAEERTRKSLRENRILLQELHHRVKNNLQVITGLIELAKSRIKDPEIRALCHDIHAKIGSIALVHSQLSREGGEGRIDFGRYARDLVDQVADMFADKGVEVRLDTEEVPLSLDKAVPCGLALNELLTNAFKHAVGRGRGRVDVSVRAGDGALAITVGDNGPGMPPPETLVREGHLGLKLLDNLVSLQLRGTIEFSPGPGTVATLTVPLG